MDRPTREEAWNAGRAEEWGALLRRTARHAGLSDCGVADVGPSEFADPFDAWIQSGSHASMEWMARDAEIRKDLVRKWEWATSALVAVLSFAGESKRRTERAPSEARGLTPYVSAYARGADYHTVMKKRLHAWADALEPALGESFRRAVLVDTSAVLERELALRAGLGWIGKNTCLIGPDGDSWRFIGVLLTDLPMRSTKARAVDRCGTCRACLDACPTQALTRPRVLDARRCISYLTIEKRGPIDPDLALEMGEWLFGCDICQEVCPWNSKVDAGDEGESEGRPFRPSEQIEQTSLADLLRMDEKTFRKRFRKTPLARPKRSGMIRNALIVGLNVGHPEIREIAESLADDADPVVRDTAKWVLEEQDKH